MSKNNKILLIVLVLIVAVSLALAFSKKRTELTQSTESAQEGATNTLPLYTLTQVSEHGANAGCWTAINGAVYDLDAWIKKHPGGDKSILMICGKDGSLAFSDQHSGERKPEKVLAGFRIGSLSE